VDERNKDNLGYTEVDFQRVIEFARNDVNGPGERTKRVYAHLVSANRFTNWDLLCFCAEYLGSQAGTLDWLMAPAKWLIRLIYMAHYIRFEKHSWLDQEVISESGQKSEMESDGDSIPGPS
jgi:hypothetical protein